MNRFAHLALVPLLVLLPLVETVRAQTLDPATATEDIKAAFEKGDYQETLRLLGRVLALKGRTAEGFDRHELLMLRAESHLRLRGQSAALAALEEAAKIAPDEQAAAKARALGMLIKRSKNLKYTPRPVAARAGLTDKPRAKGPFDITDSKQRGDALAALYAEEKAAARPKVQAADKSRTLPPVAEALKVVVPLKELELAATGQDIETSETVKDLVDRAHKLMAKALDDMTRRTERIAERANQLETYTIQHRDGTTETRTRRVGIDNEGRKELKETVQTCKLIVQSSKEIAETFTEDDEPFEDLEDQARDTGERAHQVLNDNYARLR